MLVLVPVLVAYAVELVLVSFAPVVGVEVAVVVGDGDVLEASEANVQSSSTSVVVPFPPANVVVAPPTVVLDRGVDDATELALVGGCVASLVVVGPELVENSVDD